MTLNIYPDFISSINAVQRHLRNTGCHVETESWHGLKQPIEFFEALNVSFSTMIPQSIEDWKKQIKPNLPWADDHFKERAGGVGLNPGEQYKNWPYYKSNPSNDKFRTENEKFSHTYMERFWPPHSKGVRYNMQNLYALAALMQKEPFTRQAYLPVWFPEDTGAVEGQRVPCTLGYHFIRRGKAMHVNYYIRSCDFFRHFRDDIYLCLKMLDWLMLQSHLPMGAVHYGVFTMHITSLHIFSKEYNLLKD